MAKVISTAASHPLDAKLTLELTYRELLYIRLNMGAANVISLSQCFGTTEVEYDPDFDENFLNEIGCGLDEMGVIY